MPAAADKKGRRKAAGCSGSDLAVVISLGSSCCLVVVQAASVGLAGTQGSTLIGVCAHQDGASFAPKALRPGQNSDWRLHTPSETAMKPFGGESCWRFSLLVVVSLASSCYCLAIVQAALLA